MEPAKLRNASAISIFLALALASSIAISFIITEDALDEDFWANTTHSLVIQRGNGSVQVTLQKCDIAAAGNITFVNAAISGVITNTSDGLDCWPFSEGGVDCGLELNVANPYFASAKDNITRYNDTLLIYDLSTSTEGLACDCYDRFVISLDYELGECPIMTLSNSTQEPPSFWLARNETQYGISIPLPYLNTTPLSEWSNGSCLINDSFKQARSSTTYDLCGVVENQTVWEHNWVENGCDYCQPNITNTSWSDCQYQECFINDSLLQNRSRTEYDSNHSTCCEVTGLESDCPDNITHWEYNLVENGCDYCQYSIVNTSSEWKNLSACLPNGTVLQERNITEYDENYYVCYDITGLEDDLWNNGSNNTYYDYAWNPCDYCSGVNDSCGDSVCNCGETCLSCPDDCGECPPGGSGSEVVQAGLD
jgi:hypothetical protein